MSFIDIIYNIQKKVKFNALFKKEILFNLFVMKFCIEFFIHNSIIYNSIYIIKYIIIIHCGNVGTLINKAIDREKVVENFGQICGKILSTKL